MVDLEKDLKYNTEKTCQKRSNVGGSTQLLTLIFCQVTKSFGVWHLAVFNLREKIYEGGLLNYWVQLQWKKLSRYTLILIFTHAQTWWSLNWEDYYGCSIWKWAFSQIYFGRIPEWCPRISYYSSLNVPWTTTYDVEVRDLGQDWLRLSYVKKYTLTSMAPKQSLP